MQATLQQDYVVVEIDLSEMSNAAEVAGRAGKPATSGVPWIAVVASSGDPVITSDDPEHGNCGYPVADWEIDHFMRMIRTTARRLGDGDLADLRRVLDERAQEHR